MIRVRIRAMFYNASIMPIVYWLQRKERLTTLVTHLRLLPRGCGNKLMLKQQTGIEKTTP